MIRVSEAEQIISASTLSLPQISVPLADAHGRILQETLYADRDFPPFDRVMMDGIAIAYDSWQAGIRRFEVLATQTAGALAQNISHATGCIEIMTGAICPIGADVIIPYEEIEFDEVAGKRYASIKLDQVKQRQHLHLQGSDRKAGAVLLSAGTRMEAPEIAIAATVGAAAIRCFQAPKIALLSTGDELVEVHEAPLPYQIRKSNVYMLEAALQDLPVEINRFHLPDVKAEIHAALSEILKDYQVIILSGGVSKGKADYLPEVLEELGVEKKFHRVRQRPGKPFWFGQHPAGPTVFALPGNPVSTFVGCYRYVRPWLLRQLGAPKPPKAYAELAEDFTFNPPLTYFLQVNIVLKDGKCLAYPIAGAGSGDFANLLSVNAFLELPDDRSAFQAGECFPLIGFRNLY